MGKRVCIIGGTGFVGRAITCQAIEAGHKVVVTSRHPARARDLLVKGIQVVKADITTGRGIATAVAGCDTVINLVGLLFERGSNTFEAAHVTGAKHVISACEKAGIKQLLHMSALLDPKAAQVSQYAATKIEAEKLVSASSLDWTIFRPSIIFGARDSFLMRFKALSANGPVLPVIAGDTKFQPVWVEDVARAFVLSIHNNKVAKQSFTLAGQEVFSFRDLLDLWMKALGRERFMVSMPNVAAGLLATVSNFLPTPLLTKDQLKLLAFDNVASGEAFPALFGTATDFTSLLPALAYGDQASSVQSLFDNARAHYRKS
ncbi:MAG: NAD-dependent dehydratase [Zetaproteobacteria bacterium CG2_30_46_52]|nr:MAG: NAD-dependent dehydratase [Zetaproteobacteria bacterium CG2_30_46_52]